MIIRNVNDIEPERPEGLSGVEMRVAIGKAEEAPRFALRHFKLDPDSATPRHAHWWEHEIYVIEGNGEAFTEGVMKPIQAGDTIYVPPDDEHQFVNSGRGPLKFICVIPHID